MLRKGKTCLYGDVTAGLLPSQIRIGQRASGFLVAELEAVVRARVAGCDDNVVRGLVKRLICTRGPDRDDDDVRRIAAEFHAARAQGAGDVAGRIAAKPPAAMKAKKSPTTADGKRAA
jgi:hypothetical protein